MLLSAHIEEFLKDLELDGHTSKLTVKNYDHYLKRFLHFSNNCDDGQINSNLITDYKTYLSKYHDLKTKKPLKKNTQNYFMIALRALFRYLNKKGISTISPEEVELVESEPKKPLKVLDDLALKQLLDAPNTTKLDGIRDRAILETLFSTGLRVSELASLNRDTINLESREFFITGIGGKIRHISISEQASGWLKRYLLLRKDTFSPLFIRFQGKVETVNNGEAMRLTTRSIERIVEKYAKKQNLPFKPTPQTLRNSYAAELITNGTDIHSVQEILGHNNLSTTQVYKSVANLHAVDKADLVL